MKSSREYADVVIIGGGASGLAAAIELRMSSPSVSVVILEKNSEPGRKIRATGSGRCNITNRSAEGFDDIMAFFARIGLVTRVYDNGLVYPYSESAADAACLLENRANELGVRIITDAEAQSVTSAAADGSETIHENRRSAAFETCFTVKTAGNNNKFTIASAYVILASGGKAAPMFGTTGDGYRIARSLGHSIVTPVPVLTPVECGEWAEGHIPAGIQLAGTRTRGKVTLIRGDSSGQCGRTELFSETGEIQFTKYGLSGICVFNMTRYMRYDRTAGGSLRDFTVAADLYPDGDIREFLKERRRNAFNHESVRDVLRTILKENIAAYVIGSAGIISGEDCFADKAVCDLSDADITSLGNAVHSLVFHPVRLRGWKDAQATSGGVCLDEIDPATCGSLLVPGLYITGELADRDYMCGGFNLSNAWLTGIRAARSVISIHD